MGSALCSFDVVIQMSHPLSAAGSNAILIHGTYSVLGSFRSALAIQKRRECFAYLRCVCCLNVSCVP